MNFDELDDHECHDIEVFKSLYEDISKQKNQAYAERNKVVAALAHLINDLSVFVQGFDVKIAQHDPNDKIWDSDWRTILVLTINGKQMTWHFHDSEKYLLEGLQPSVDYKWDGHSTEEKYKRLLKVAGIKILEAQR